MFTERQFKNYDKTSLKYHAIEGVDGEECCYCEHVDEADDVCHDKDGICSCPLSVTAAKGMGCHLCHGVTNIKALKWSECDECSSRGYLGERDGCDGCHSGVDDADYYCPGCDNCTDPDNPYANLG